MTAVAPILLADARSPDLRHDPIPAEDVIAGMPLARSLALTASADGRLTTALWDCTAGRFRWRFWCDEIVHILEGEVHVSDEQGQTVTLRQGDVAHFAPGAVTVWDVPEHVRKLAVHRRAPTDLVSRLVRRLRRER